MADEFVGSTRNDEIDVLAELKEGIHGISGGHKLDRVVGNLRALECLGDDCGDDLE